MYSENDFRLYHHGILGQKWGKLNGPPYPIDSGDHSASEKKAGWRKSLKIAEKEHASEKRGVDPDKVKKYLAEIDKKPFEERRKEITPEERQAYRKEMISRGKDVNFYKNATDEEIDNDIEKKQRLKKALIVATATVGITAAGYMAYRAGVFDKLNGKTFSETELKRAFALVNKKSLDDIGLVLDKNTVLHRMVGYSDFDMDKVKGPLYASYKDTDVSIYKIFLKDFLGTGKRFDVSLGIKDRIAAPSEEKTKKIIEDLFNHDQSFATDLARTLLDLHYPNNWTQADLRHATQEVLEQDSKWKFDQVIWAMARTGNVATKMTEAVQKEGFNALIDFHDKGTVSDMPIIVLNGQKDLIKKGEKFVGNISQNTGFLQGNEATKAIQYIKDHISEISPGIVQTLGLNKL